MKIERINDNQFRCIMTLGELLQRHLTIKKISSDSAEARRLVREMLERSTEELGFEPNNLPVMVETVRGPEGNLVFTVTKINSPEELPPHYRHQLEAMQTIQRIVGALVEQNDAPKQPQLPPLAVFSFPEQYGVKLPPRLQTVPRGISSSLYRMPEVKQYFLVVSSSHKQLESFRQLCYLLGEYGRQIPSTFATKAYYREHGQTIFANRAIERIQAGELKAP